jgi:hypothetical protein
MARPDGESEPNEAMDGTRIATNTSGSRRRVGTNQGGAPAEEKKPNRLAALVAKLGIDAGIIIIMFK